MFIFPEKKRMWTIYAKTTKCLEGDLDIMESLPEWYNLGPVFSSSGYRKSYPSLLVVKWKFQSKIRCR